jgi:uncharacterized surface protein with fasciclin (FAS1) repeats
MVFEADRAPFDRLPNHERSYAMKRSTLTGLSMLASAATLMGAAVAYAQTAPAGSQTTPPAQDQAAPAAPDAAQLPPNPDVGGAKMLPGNTIVQNAEAASNLSTLVEAVKAAGLDQTLSEAGPYTVFAPTNDAFGRLAPGTVQALLKPENKPTLTKVLTYHVVPGSITIEDLKAKAAANGGKVTLTTVEGEPLTVTVDGQVIALTDVNGNKSYIETADVRQANGVVHVVNGVILPKLG